MSAEMQPQHAEPDDGQDLAELEPIEALPPDTDGQIAVMVVLRDDLLIVLEAMAEDRGISLEEAAQRVIEEGVESRRARDRALAAARAA